MTEFSGKVSNFIKYFCIVFLSVFLVLIILGAFIYKAEFCMFAYGDTSVLLPQNPIYLIIGILVSIFFYKILFALTRSGKNFEIFKNGWPLILVSACLQISVILFFRIKLTADWEVLDNIAKEFLKGNLTSLQKGGYLYAYPHNLGTTLYFALLHKLIPANIYFPRLLNVIYSLITIIVLNKMFTLLSPNYNKYSKQFFIITFLFLPPIFMSNLTYNEVFSTMLYLVGIYCSVRFTTDRKTGMLLGIVLAFSLAHFIRSIGFLFAVATLAYFFLIRIDIKKIILFTVLIIIGFNLPLFIINRQLHSKGLISEPLGKNSIPISKWLHMGLNEKYFGYWDQGESYWIYPRDAKWNKKEADYLYRQGIKNKISEYGWLKTANIYFKKVVWLWTEGTYQSVYLGMGHSSPGGYMEETPVGIYFEEDIKRRDMFKVPMYFLNITSLFTIMAFMIYTTHRKLWKSVNKEMILFLLLLTFICFYLFWEVKPRYIYPVYPYILLLGFISYINIFRKEKVHTKIGT